MKNLRHLRQRGKKNIWWIDLVGSDGKRIQKSLKTCNKQIAEEKLREVQGQVDRQVLNLKIRPDSVPLKNFFEDYLIFCKTNHAPRTFQMERLLLQDVPKENEKRKKPLSENFRSFCEKESLSALTHLTPVALEKYKAWRQKTAGAALLNRELNIIKALINRALSEGRLHSNPLKDLAGKSLVKKLPETKKKIRFLSLEEIKRLMEAAAGSPLWQRIIGVALNSGLRRSELSCLRWENVDLERRILTVVSAEDGSFTTKFGKTREIPMNGALFRIFSEMQEDSNGRKYVFATRNDTPLAAHFNREFNRFVAKAEIRKIIFHDLRHTFASHLVLSGVALPLVRDLMGHSDIKTTMIYSQVRPDNLQEAVSRLQLEGVPA